MNVAVTTAAEGFPRRAFTVDDITRMIEAGECTTFVHTGPSGEGWSSIVKRGPQDAHTTSALPGFSMRLGEIG
jgi:hypothetical protein